MALEKRPGKRPRVEETGVDRRKGVTRRQNPTGYVHMVEMRFPKSEKKMNFGTYKDKDDAMIARDCGAFIRNSTGKEALATVGGYDPAVHPSIYEFEESREIFESLEGLKARCEEYKRLIELKTGEECEFCKAVRRDIRDAILMFRSKFPNKFLRNGPLNHVPKATPLDGEFQSTPPPSSSEVRVPPSPGCEVGATMGDGSMNFNDGVWVEVFIAVDGFPLQTLLRKKVLLLTAEEILEITKVGVDKIDKDISDKMWEDVPPCTIDPTTIPPLE